MVAMPLDEGQITAGADLLEQLDAANVHVGAALWYYFPDNENWRLLLSLPRLVRQGPRAAYREVQKALSKLGGEVAISLDDVAITKPEDRVFKLLRIAISTRPGISRLRFSRNVINGELVEDALIYRLT